MSIFYDDEFSGMGGSYLIDPETGKRVLVERTEEAEPQPILPPVEAQE